MSCRGPAVHSVPRHIRDYLGIRPGNQTAFVLTEHGILVKKLMVQTEAPPRESPADALRELVLAIGCEAQMQGLSEEDVEQDISQYLERMAARLVS